MKKLTFLGIAFMALAAASPAQAGGSWTGFYAGGNAGYAWGSADNTLAISDGVNCHFCFASDISAAQSAGSPGFSPNGFSGGGQFGYNWQTFNWVYGVEFDVESFSQKQTVNNSVSLPANTAGASCFTAGAVSCVGNFSTSIKTDWLITLRPRLGYSWDQTLVYVTGGLAFTKLSYSQSYSDNLNFAPGNVGGSVTTSASDTKVGWVVGGGFERMIADNWSARAEYLYVRFDGLNANGTLTDSSPGFIANFANNMDHFSSNIVRVGFNYRFSPAP